MEQNNLPQETYDLLKLRGLEKETAIKLLQKDGYEVRIVEEDGKAIRTNYDYQFNRVNLAINDGVVTDIYAG